MPIFQELLLRQNLRLNSKYLGWKKGNMEYFGGSPVSFAACDCEHVQLWARGLGELKIKFLFLGKEAAHPLQSSALPLPLRWSWDEISPSKYHRIFCLISLSQGKRGRVNYRGKGFVRNSLSILLSLIPVQHFVESIARQGFEGVIPKLSANKQRNEMKWSLKASSCSFIYIAVLDCANPGSNGGWGNPAGFNECTVSPFWRSW